MIGNRYGAGSGMILLDDVQCIGTETSLAYCSHGGWGVSDCVHNEDVSISCGTSTVIQGMVLPVAVTPLCVLPTGQTF